MGINIRLPQINGATDKERMEQTKSYLIYLANQLQWALSNTDASNGTVITPTAKSLASGNTNAVSAQATFNAIKSLIIKSADIVEAYTEEINSRLVGAYVAESDFGKFVEQTELEITRSSTAITENYENVQQIFTDIENLNFTLAEVNAHIRSGHLYNNADGIPVYGLEIGQINTIDGEEVFNKFARFTADRLSFYDQNDSEVAYISDYKLHITHAEVTGTLNLGGYLVDTSKGLAFKWVGRG